MLTDRKCIPYIELILLFILLLVLIPGHYHYGDMGYWKEWTLYLFKHGLGEAYNSDINYPPIMLYICYLYSHIQGSEAKIVENISYIRIITVALDFVPALLLLCSKRFAPEQKKLVWL